MAKRATRVLIDLSVAARGYCGMAQDVRLLYKALASCPELDVTGLLYLPRRLRPSHRFLPASAPRGDRLANQACFLWEFDTASGTWPPVDWLRRLKHFRELAMTAWGPKVELDRLDVEVFWDVVWRLIFSPTLAAEDLPLVQNGKFLLSNLSDGMFQARTLLRRRPHQARHARLRFFDRARPPAVTDRSGDLPNRSLSRSDPAGPARHDAQPLVHQVAPSGDYAALEPQDVRLQLGADARGPDDGLSRAAGIEHHDPQHAAGDLLPGPQPRRGRADPRSAALGGHQRCGAGHRPAATLPVERLDARTTQEFHRTDSSFQHAQVAGRHGRHAGAS